MRPPLRQRPTLAGSLVVAIVMALAACAAPSTSSSGPLGFAAAPAGLDPGSPAVSAASIAFDRTDVRVPAGRAFVLVIRNHDNLPHNISIYRDAAFKNRIFEGVIFEGPGTRWYPVAALALGTTYFFQCDIHPIPSMQGTLTPGI